MAHIHTDPGQHDLTASAFIVRTDLPEPVILLHMHRRMHKWMQFGGHVELHENPWQAVAHELLEESGYELSQLRLLQPDLPRLRSASPGVVIHPYPVSFLTGPFPGIDHHHTDTAFAFVTNETPKHRTADGESSLLRLFSREEVIALPDSEILGSVRDIIVFIFDECLPNWQQTLAADWE